MVAGVTGPAAPTRPSRPIAADVSGFSSSGSFEPSLPLPAAPCDPLLLLEFPGAAFEPLLPCFAAAVDACQSMLASGAMPISRFPRIFCMQQVERAEETWVVSEGHNAPIQSTHDNGKSSQ